MQFFVFWKFKLIGTRTNFNDLSLFLPYRGYWDPERERDRKNKKYFSTRFKKKFLKTIKKKIVIFESIRPAGFAYLLKKKKNRKIIDNLKK